MIEHVSLRCRDVDASCAFYEKALAPLGYSLSKRYGDSFGFKQGGRHDFWVTSGKLGTPLHLAFHAEDRAAVAAFYDAALESGGKDNGPPGVREDYGFAAFVIDPDGNNIEAVIWKEEEKPLPQRSGRKRIAAAAAARSVRRRSTSTKAKGKASARGSAKRKTSGRNRRTRS